jgi:hypothetical protein
MKVKYDRVFNRKGSKLKPSEKALIQIEAYLDGKRRYFSTGLYITSSQWDNKRKAVRNHPDGKAYNQSIQKSCGNWNCLKIATLPRLNPFSEVF